MSLVHACNGGHYLSRRAVPALKAVLIDEGLLHWMQLPMSLKPLYRSNLFALNSNGQSEARQYALAVDMDCASSALPLVAAFFCTGQEEVFAQCIENS